MKMSLWSFFKLFTISFALIAIALYCNARWLTPLPDNDSDFAAWGMRYALIPVAAFLYAIVTSILTLLTKAVLTKIGVLKKASETKN